LKSLARIEMEILRRDDTLSMYLPRKVGVLLLVVVIVQIRRRKKYTITAGFVTCWVAALILPGAHFGAGKRLAGKLWQAQPYGISIPYLQNSMTRDACIFMRQYIHFADNSMRQPKGEVIYDALLKVQYALDTMMKAMRKILSHWKACDDCRNYDSVHGPCNIVCSIHAY